MCWTSFTATFEEKKFLVIRVDIRMWTLLPLAFVILITSLPSKLWMVMIKIVIIILARFWVNLFSLFILVCCLPVVIIKELPLMSIQLTVSCKRIFFTSFQSFSNCITCLPSRWSFIFLLTRVNCIQNISSPSIIWKPFFSHLPNFPAIIIV